MYILLCMRVARERESVDDYVLKSSNVNLHISPIRLNMLIFSAKLELIFRFCTCDTVRIFCTSTRDVLRRTTD